MEYIKGLKGKKISVDHYFNNLLDLGWKYDLEESDLFIELSKTFWSEGIKVSLKLQEYCCVPPNGEISRIIDLIFYSFDILQFPKRDINSLFEEMKKNEFNTWENLDEYIMHLEDNYPFYIPSADFNTGLGHDDVELLEKLNLKDIPKSVLENILDDFKKVEYVVSMLGS